MGPYLPLPTTPPATLSEAIGRVIRQKRRGVLMTLQELGDEARVSVGYLSQIELGKNHASVEVLRRICDVLGMKLSNLFRAVEDRHLEPPAE